MKILHVITSLQTGGAEKLLVDSVPLYQEKGLSVDVLSLLNRRTAFWTILEKYTTGKVFGLTLKSVYNPILVFKLIPYLRKYDLIHVHLFPALYWVVIAKWLSFSKTAIVYTEHNTDNKRRHNPVLRSIDRLIYRGVARIVTIASEVDLKLKAHLQYKENKYYLINNGVDVNFFSKANALPKKQFFSENNFILIQVSSFRNQKDQQTVIKSLTYLPESICLLLVGEGILLPECESIVKELQLNHRVKFLGIRTDIPQLLKTADIVVLSSRHEGLSLSSIEGMACAPFIASNVPGLREVVEGAGLLFEQGNSEELARHILKLYQDKAYYQQIADQCLERAKQFDINRMIDSYIKIYEQYI